MIIVGTVVMRHKMLVATVQCEEETAPTEKLPGSRESPQDMKFCYRSDIVKGFFLQKFTFFLQCPCQVLVSCNNLILQLRKPRST